MKTFKRYTLAELLPVIATSTIVVKISVVIHKFVRHVLGVDILHMHKATINTPSWPSRLPPTLQNYSKDIKAEGQQVNM